MEKRTPIIVIADDDADDRLFLKEAFERCREDIIVHLVEDGEKLMDYLCRRGSYANPPNGYRPDLIIVDLCMPRKDGFEIIEEIKTDSELKRIPLLAYTALDTDENVKRCYDLGVNTVIHKQNTFDELEQTAKSIYNYWFKAIKD
ncbi:MAG: response regulator [Syntrophobacteraceae bacterium]